MKEFLCHMTLGVFLVILVVVFIGPPKDIVQYVILGTLLLCGTIFSFSTYNLYIWIKRHEG